MNFNKKNKKSACRGNNIFLQGRMGVRWEGKMGRMDRTGPVGGGVRKRKKREGWSFGNGVVGNPLDSLLVPEINPYIIHDTYTHTQIIMCKHFHTSILYIYMSFIHIMHVWIVTGYKSRKCVGRRWMGARNRKDLQGEALFATFPKFTECLCHAHLYGNLSTIGCKCIQWLLGEWQTASRHWTQRWIIVKQRQLS